MKKSFTLLLCSLFLFSQATFAQVFVEEFDNEDPAYMGGAALFNFAEENGELTITTSSATGSFDNFTYEMHNAAGMTQIIDATDNNKIFVRAKASNVGTQFRMDIEDADGYATTQNSIVKTLTTEYQVLEFDFTGLYIDGGFGGTSCTTGPCPVDGSQARQLVFYPDPAIGGFGGTIVIDYIAFGEEPTGIIMSDVFQDHFEMDSSINAFYDVGPGYQLELANSNLVITGDGTNPMWDPITYFFRNPNTLEEIDIDASGNNKFYIRAKSSVEGTVLRADLQDIDTYVTTQGSITKLLTTEYVTYEFDYSGAFFDLGYGGTPCTDLTAPCPVNAERIGNLVFFIEPGVGEFLGQIDIDYISFDIPLEPPGPEPDLIYSDHFNNETLDFTGEVPGFAMVETGSEWIITADNSAPQYTPFSYILHDKDTGEQLAIDMGPAQNKVFIKIKTTNGDIPLRLDLIDSLGFATTQTSLTRVIGEDYTVYEFNFTDGYFDGGFGGTACPDVMETCDVDPTIIRQMLLYPDPILADFEGDIIIDFISIGQPVPDDPGLGPVGNPGYSDQMDDNTGLFVTDPGGLVSSFGNDEWTITGDGTGQMWDAINYDLHTLAGQFEVGNAVADDNKIFFSAKSTVDSTEIRFDIEDSQGYHTNFSAQSDFLGTEYQTFELDFTDAYLDGAFGGTPCMTSTCDVDGERVKALKVFLKPGVGAFEGEVVIDWISFGNPIGVYVEDPSRLSRLVAYPNPANDVLTLDFETIQSGDMTVSIFNAIGNLVHQNDLGFRHTGKAKEQLNVANLAPGIYMITLQMDGGHTGSLKFVKE